MFYLLDLLETSTKHSANFYLTPLQIHHLKTGSHIEIEVKGKKKKCEVIWDSVCARALRCQCVNVACCLCKHRYNSMKHEQFEKEEGKELETWLALGYPKPYTEAPPKPKLTFGVVKK